MSTFEKKKNIFQSIPTFIPTRLPATDFVTSPDQVHWSLFKLSHTAAREISAIKRCENNGPRGIEKTIRTRRVVRGGKKNDQRVYCLFTHSQYTP